MADPQAESDPGKTTPRRLDLQEETLSRSIYVLALPAILENLLFSAVFMADTFIVGWLKDPPSLAATGMVGILMWLLNAPFHALSIAANSLVARCWGEHDFASARRYAGQTLSVSFLLATGILIFTSPYTRGIIERLGGSTDVAALGGMYLRIVLLSIVFGLPMIVSNDVIRATGDTKTPMVFALIMNVINVIASVSLAFGLGPVPALGLAGVAWGTVIARTTGGFLSIGFLCFAKRGAQLRLADLFSFRRKDLARLRNLALPAILDRGYNSVAHLLFMRIVTTLGTVAMAAHNIALQAETIAFMPAVGLSAAVSTIVGQAIGSRKPHIAEITVKRALLWAAGFTLFMGIVFLLTASRFMSIFGATPEVLRVAAICLRISAIEVPFLSFSIILSASLRGAGDTASPFWASLVGILVFRLSAAYLFAIVLGWGMAGIWLATAFDWFARSAGLWVIFRRGLWKSLHEAEKRRYAHRTEENPVASSPRKTE
jgi:putative MATE family efflux protein